MRAGGGVTGNARHRPNVLPGMTSLGTSGPGADRRRAADPAAGRRHRWAVLGCGALAASSVLAVAAPTVGAGATTRVGVRVGAASRSVAAARVRTAVRAVTAPPAVPSDTSAAGRAAPDLGLGAPYGGRFRATAFSQDWSGFAVTGTTVTQVSGSWTQPAVTCGGAKVQQSAFWVGIDGFAASDPTVEQVGTDSDCTKHTKKVPGGPVYYAWFELYPSALVTLGPAHYPVSAGDSLSASVDYSGGVYVLSIIDAGRWSYSTSVATTAPRNASAEWVAEAPTSCTAGRCKVQQLANFGSVTFRWATVNGQALTAGGTTVTRIVMSRNKKGVGVEASPSALDATGHEFTVTWLSI